LLRWPAPTCAARCVSSGLRRRHRRRPAGRQRAGPRPATAGAASGSQAGADWPVNHPLRPARPAAGARGRSGDHNGSVSRRRGRRPRPPGAGLTLGLGAARLSVTVPRRPPAPDLRLTLGSRCRSPAVTSRVTGWHSADATGAGGRGADPSVERQAWPRHCPAAGQLVARPPVPGPPATRFHSAVPRRVPRG